MRAFGSTQDPNLTELRGQLAMRIALVFVAASLLLSWLALLPERFPFEVAGLLAGLTVLGLLVRLIGSRRLAVAPVVMVIGIAGWLLVAVYVLTDPWVPFLALPLSVIAALLASGGGFVTAAPAAVLVTVLALRQGRSYPLAQYLGLLGFSVMLGWLAMRTLFTALEWAWTMQQRADELLARARDRQGDLARALHSLDKTNWILRRTQRELVVARRRADEARRMKEQFAANISHELRTPLNLILGFSELMYLSPSLYGELQWPPRLRRAIHQIYRSSRHLLEMINDVLDLSRIEIVGFTLDRDTYRLEPLLEETAEIARDLFEGQDVALELTVEGNLPAVDIDRTRIRQVLLNLLSNAARFTEQGTVRVAAWTEEHNVVVSVSDTGPGIPADKLPYLFREFYQVDHSLQRKPGGTGLGLALCKHFVEAHDGAIWVESQEGVGSTFSFSLPIPGSGPPISHLETDDHVPGTVHPTGAPALLVIDPDPSVANLIGRHLEGFDMLHARSPEDAVVLVGLHHPRAVVWNKVPGFPRQEPILSPPVPIIECSLPSRRWLEEDLGVRKCLTKPITTVELREALGGLDDVRDVLVVDDERGFCQLVEQMLGTFDADLTVRTAYSGSEGLQALRAQPPDLLLLDLIMPGVDGFDVLKEMSADEQLSSIPTVLLTATRTARGAMDQGSEQIVIRRYDGLTPREVLGCIRAAISVVEPHYDDRDPDTGEGDLEPVLGVPGRL